MPEAVIVSTARTPIGKAFRGAFNKTHGAVLASHAIRHAVERAGIEPGEVEDVIFGCGLPEGATGHNKELGLKIFSVHKGYSSQSRTLGHLAHPGDIEKAALDHPDLTFVIYHSAVRHGPREEAAFEAMYDPETGDFEWHADLIKLKQRNPRMTNVYPELGSAFNILAIAHPEMCMHVMGRNIKYYGADHVVWGTDCLWWGSPQWCIDAFKRFQISDEMCEKWGYEKITQEDKAKIFGLNAAKIYGIDPKAKINTLPDDVFSRLKTSYIEDGGHLKYRSNAVHGWVVDDVLA